jgi:hypothetical protein
VSAYRRFKRWAYEHRVRWHAQNLDRDGRGSMWREGRAWVNVWTGDGDTGEGYRELFEINPEWHFRLQPRAGAGITLGGGDSDAEIGLFLSTPLCSLYLNVDGIPRRFFEAVLPYRLHTFTQRGHERTVKITEAREIRVDCHNGAIWWSLWHSVRDWHNGTPRWRNGSFSPLDFLLGRHKYSRVELSRRREQIPFPEAIYDAEIVLTEDTWRRPRWPFPRRIKRAHVEVERGVPVPGKGENSWDCGEDARFSLTTPARNTEEAIVKFVASVYGDRVRYGGSMWKPEVSA